MGYEILVYQDSINKLLPEYLVNHNFFIKTMEKFGFSLISQDECKSNYGFSFATDTFDKLYKRLDREFEDSDRNYSNSEKEYGKALQMTREEKSISFLNRYYIFKKRVNIDSNRMAHALLNGTSYENEISVVERQHEREIIADIGKTISKKIEKKEEEQFEFEESKGPEPSKNQRSIVIDDDSDEIVFDTVIIDKPKIDEPKTNKKTKTDKPKTDKPKTKKNVEGGTSSKKITRKIVTAKT